MNKQLEKTVINNFINYVKLNIIDLTKKELSNTEKKEKLDKAVYVYLETLIAGVKVNFLIRWIVEKFVINNIPVITQVVYDLLKSRLYPDEDIANNTVSKTDTDPNEL